MTKEEAIAVIERLAHTESKWPGTEETLEALDIAVKALRSLPTTEDKNVCAMPEGEPLTRDQLRQMVGRWVWVVVNYANAEASYKCDGWAKVVTYGTVAYFDQSLKVSELGTRFEAYTQPVSNFGVRLLYREGIKVDAKTE